MVLHKAINKLLGRNESNPFGMEDYSRELDCIMTFHSDPEKIKEAMSSYNENINTLLDSGEVLPYEIAYNFEYIPVSVWKRVTAIEWQIRNYDDFTDLRDLVNTLVYSKNLLWQIHCNEEYQHFITDKKSFSGWNLQYFSHMYLWERLVQFEFNGEFGVDGSLKPIWKF